MSEKGEKKMKKRTRRLKNTKWGFFFHVRFFSALFFFILFCLLEEGAKRIYKKLRKGGRKENTELTEIG